MKKNCREIKDVVEHLSQTSDRNLTYYYVLDQIKSQKTSIPEIHKFISLLDLIDLDKTFTMIRYQSDKQIYEKFKTRSAFNQSYEIADENKSDYLNYASAYRPLSDEDRAAILRIDSIMPGGKLKPGERSEVFADLLFDQLDGLVKIDSENRRLFYRKGNAIEVIDGYDDTSFARFFQLPVNSTITVKETIDSIKMLKDRLNSNSNYLRNSIIQFDDCYIEEGVLKKGFYEDGFARFTIKRKVWNAASTGKVTKHVKEVDQLLLHLCNYDQPTFERIRDVFSTVFLNSKYHKSRYNFSPRIVGKDGANGKSTFQDLISRAFNGDGSFSQVCSSFTLQNLDKRDTLYKVANSLVAIDSDSSSKTISEDCAAMFKSVTSGDSIDTRALFKESENIESRCLLVEFSNDFPKSSDKSTAYLRRLELVECKYQLMNEDNTDLGANSKYAKIDLSDEWFERINSEEAAQYLIEMLLIRAMQIYKEKKIAPRSLQMQSVLTAYSHSNNSALAYFSEVGLDKIVGFGVSEVKKAYEDWCAENDLTAMKQKFIETLESKGLRRKSVRISFVDPSSECFMQLRAGKATVSAWQYADEQKNAEYFKQFESKIEEVGHSIENDIIDQFVEQLTLDKIVNHRVLDIREQFEEYCSKLKIEISNRIFNQRLKDKYHLDRKNRVISKIALSDEERDYLPSDSYFSCWIKSE